MQYFEVFDFNEAEVESLQEYADALEEEVGRMAGSREDCGSQSTVNLEDTGMPDTHGESHWPVAQSD